VGYEGIVGIALFMGGDTMPNRAVVQSAGHAYRLPGQVLKQEFNRAGALQHLLLRYTLAMLTQMAQTAVCRVPPPSPRRAFVNREAPLRKDSPAPASLLTSMSP
jgi:hypothetical protein